MFGSSPFGQSSSSPFGSPSVFGQASNAGNTNPFAPKPFGTTTPFGSQTGGSIFGGTSTGVFGAQSTPSAFGSSTPAFGASTTPAFGQTPAFGGFGSSNTQSSPFGGQSQPSQPAFGSGLFGSSTPFGAASQPAFGATSSPAFGASTTPAFGATSTSPFGSTTNTTFGSTGGAFGMSSSSLFGSSTPAFGAASTPAFGAASTPAFGAASTPAFGATNTPAFGATNTPAFGATNTPFGAASTPAFGAATTPSFGSSFGQSTSTFGAQNSPFGAQATTTAFGGSAFGQSGLVGQRGGTRVTPYAPTPDPDGTGSQAGKLESISAMPAYKEKSHEELRWEDYQSGDKGGPAPAGQSPGLNQPSNIFSSPTSSNPFAQKPTGFNSIGSASAPTFNSSPFGVSNNANPFGATTASTPSLFNASASPFGTSTTTSVFGSSSNSGLATAPSFFNSSPAQATTNFSTGLNFGNTQSSPLFQSTTPSLPQGSLGFGQTNSAFGQTNSTFGQTSSAFGQQTNPTFGQTNSTFGQTNPTFGQTNSAFGQNAPTFSLPSTGFGLSSTPTLQAAPSLSMPFQSTQTAQPSGTFGFNNIGQTQSATSSALGITPSFNFNGQMQSTTQSSAIAQPMPVMNPFGTLPAMPQMSIGRTGTSSSIQYGISSLPVVDKPAPVRISSLLTSRHLTQRRFRLPARKYNPKSDGPKVPFFGDEEETESTPKADALFVPRENPRALVVRPLDQWHSKLSAERTAPSNQTSLTNGNGKLSEAGLYPKLNGSSVLDTDGERAEAGRQTQKQNGFHEEAAHVSEKEDSYTTITGHRAGEAAIVYEHGADIEALMPKLRHSATSGYYTVPRIQELAAKERAVPGSCRHVRDFVVGRKGYGSIKFIGETDVRRLDLENIVEFNNREVVVYPDESKKPPVGQGLNKPAEVTLLNVKFFNKKTGEQLTEGASAERCKANLIKKSAEQGAEFLSYDPLKGEWRFRVNHFSVYKLEEEGVFEGELRPSG